MTSTVSMDPRLVARRVEVLRRQGRRRLRVVLVAAALAATALAGWWVMLRSPLLDVDAVTVEGAAMTATEDIIAASGITEGEPLVDVDTSGARAAIADLPWVHEVRSDRTLAGHVRFRVTERSAVAVVPGTTGWLLVDADGRVLEHLDEVPADVVVVDGPRWQVAPGGWVGEGALGALEVAALLPVGLRSRVTAVEIGDDALDLVLFGGGRVALGDAAELDDKFLAALTLLVRVEGACLDTIDVRAPAVPVLTRLDDCS